jgi:hypothetical protein
MSPRDGASKVRLEERFDDTAQRLLHNPVPNRWYTQQTLATVLLGDHCAFDRLRSVALLFDASLRLTPSGLTRKFAPGDFFLQFEQQARQLRLQIGLKRTQALPINSGRTLVTFDVSEGFIQSLL